ncbi:hypothetical protein BDC45DRAFT_544974 [Circinella umbellata]|nr:hypothetical protein BDC45DRAFT_544974 [Circinella umbellata]
MDGVLRDRWKISSGNPSITICNLSVSIARFKSEKRNSLENLEERHKWFMGLESCVFIDDSGFPTNMRKSFAWSRVGTRPVVKTSVARAVTHTVLGAITVNTKDVEAEAMIEEEQENEDDDKPAPEGTTSVHDIKFISEVLDVMNEIGNMEGYYFRKIIRRAYSPELDLIENFWSLIKGKMKRVSSFADTHPSELYAFADLSKGQITIIQRLITLDNMKYCF